ncbi:MAG: nucleoside monophosphate kinase [Parcubacteria group bacterium]|nr:nucleoside monophosphate kinase [Parcubacteria group bacterium]
MPKIINVSLTGRSGSGKGTQADLLMERFKGMFYLSTGDLFRDLAKQDTATSHKIQKVLAEGGLPFDDIAVALMIHNIAYNVKEEQGILFDGVTRRVSEAEIVDGFMDWLGRRDNTFHILIDVSRDEAYDRLSKRRICKECGNLIPWVGEFKDLKVCDKCKGELMTRPDDIPDAINNRLDYFEEKVVQTIDYYEKQGRLIKINGEQSIEDVFKDILKALGEK